MHKLCHYIDFNIANLYIRCTKYAKCTKHAVHIYV